ncbi:Alpha carbonic anhydrase [Macleaya cordata]|uniref:Carbonic anhydrase n=1 Tax=Macleaya cordata TaxID=56857 RepID=A0A200Q6B4_MACCD|nr:Alpha carbonic anhydrase [Macleaya cordata]
MEELTFAAQKVIFFTGIAVLLTATLTDQYALNFTYSGATTGPDKWGSLSPSFWACSKGKSQSPINIVKKDAIFNPRLGHLTRDYISANGTLINNGFNIGLVYTNGCGKAILDGKDYTLKQVHWHSPSEHTINGVRYPLELHLVHVAGDGSISVVAVLHQYGNPDPLLAQIKSSLDELEKEKYGGNKGGQVPVGRIRSKLLKRKTMKYWTYVGSLTVPPCTEKVNWYILGKVRQISKEQIDAIKAPLDGTCKNNSRPIQPLNGRRVEFYDGHARAP